MNYTQLVPRKTVGRYIVYERVPKPVGATRYVVGEGDGSGVAANRLLEDFGRYSRAVRWCKANAK